jgi:endonuclease-8
VVPEGDTIWRTAERLRPALLGRRVVSFRAERVVGGVRAGSTVDEVVARGKFLLVRFGDGQTLETHMKMTGSWHLYRVGERWRRRASGARAVIEVDNGWIAVCFSAPHVRLIAGNGSRAATTHLGPDLTSPEPDLIEAAARFDRFAGAETPAAVALLDQRICCGVGNVYKSEVLHALGISPDRPVGRLEADERAAIVSTAHSLLRANLGPGPRTTVAGGLAVYGRAGSACPRCGEVVRRTVHGEHARSTYWCPGCQH